MGTTINVPKMEEKKLPVSLPYVENIQKFHATCATCDKQSETKIVQERTHNYDTRAKQKAQTQLKNLQKIELNLEQKDFVTKQITENNLDNKILIEIMNLYAKDICSFYVEDLLAFGGGPFVNLYGRIEIVTQSFPRKRQEMSLLKEELKQVETEFHRIANSIQTSQTYEVGGKVILLEHANDWIEAMNMFENMLINIKNKIIQST